MPSLNAKLSREIAERLSVIRSRIPHEAWESLVETSNEDDRLTYGLEAMAKVTDDEVVLTRLEAAAWVSFIDGPLRREVECHAHREILAALNRLDVTP